MMWPSDRRSCHPCKCRQKQLENPLLYEGRRDDVFESFSGGSVEDLGQKGECEGKA